MEHLLGDVKLLIGLNFMDIDLTVATLRNMNLRCKAGNDFLNITPDEKWILHQISLYKQTTKKLPI